MHIAICVYGFTSWWMLARFQASMHHYVLGPLQVAGFTYDLLLHSYYSDDNCKDKHCSSTRKFVRSALQSSLHPQYLQIESKKDLSDEWNNSSELQTNSSLLQGKYLRTSTIHMPVPAAVSSENITRTLHSLYHITAVLKNMQAIRNYDLVLFINNRVLFLAPLPIVLLPDIVNSHYLLLPDQFRSCQGDEVNADIAIAGYSAALLYGKQLQSYHDYLLQYQHSELEAIVNLQKIAYFHLHQIQRIDEVRILEFPWQYDYQHIDRHQVITGRNTIVEVTKEDMMTSYPLINAIEKLFSYKQWRIVHDYMFCSPFHRITKYALQEIIESAPVSINDRTRRTMSNKQRFRCELVQQVVRMPSSGDAYVSRIPKSCRIVTKIHKKNNALTTNNKRQYRSKRSRKRRNIRRKKKSKLMYLRHD